MPWWSRHALLAAAIAAGVALLGVWARHSYEVMQGLAGITLAALLIGGFWFVAGAADEERKRRSPPPSSDPD